jgi:type II secretory pathway pseudopilin PulG
MIPSTCKTQAHRHEAGFTYLGVLFAVALMGAMLASIATIWHQVQQREKEKQLLFVGKQFRQAIASYYENSPGLARQFPKSLDDLLEDRRVPFTRRHLRKIFYDPLTGSTDWGLVKDAGGGITGVYSKSDDEPLKKANFAEQFAQFEDKKRYSDWRFVYAPGSVPAIALAQNGSEIPALPPGEAIPPEYVAPPPKPPESGSPDDRKKFLCDVMRSNDMRTCLTLAKKFGDAAGANCLASAAGRYSSCRNGERLSPLAVQY